MLVLLSPRVISLFVLKRKRKCIIPPTFWLAHTKVKEGENSLNTSMVTMCIYNEYNQAKIKGRRK